MRKLLKVTNDIIQARDQGKLVLLDFSKAVNTISRKILLAQLHQFGCNGTAVQLTLSYLSDRYQVVSLQDHSSSPFSINTGAP